MNKIDNQKIFWYIEFLFSNKIQAHPFYQLKNKIMTYKTLPPPTRSKYSSGFMHKVQVSAKQIFILMTDYQYFYLAQIYHTVILNIKGVWMCLKSLICHQIQ